MSSTVSLFSSSSSCGDSRFARNCCIRNNFLYSSIRLLTSPSSALLLVSITSLDIFSNCCASSGRSVLADRDDEIVSSPLLFSHDNKSPLLQRSNSKLRLVQARTLGRTTFGVNAISYVTLGSSPRKWTLNSTCPLLSSYV